MGSAMFAAMVMKMMMIMVAEKGKEIRGKKKLEIRKEEDKD